MDEAEVIASPTVIFRSPDLNSFVSQIGIAGIGGELFDEQDLYYSDLNNFDLNNLPTNSSSSNSGSCNNGIGGDQKEPESEKPSMDSLDLGDEEQKYGSALQQNQEVSEFQLHNRHHHHHHHHHHHQQQPILVKKEITKPELGEKTTSKRKRKVAPQRKSENMPTSVYRGVSYKKKESKWVAQIKYKGVQHYLGIYYTEEEAARAYDLRAREYYGDTELTNFKSDEEAKQICIEAARRNGTEVACMDSEVKKQPTSSYRGVSFKNKDMKWVSQIRHNGRQFYLGIFETEMEAALAYDRSARIYHGARAKLNFPDASEIDLPIKKTRPKRSRRRSHDSDKEKEKEVSPTPTSRVTRPKRIKTTSTSFSEDKQSHLEEKTLPSSPHHDSSTTQDVAAKPKASQNNSFGTYFVSDPYYNTASMVFNDHPSPFHHGPRPFIQHNQSQEHPHIQQQQQQQQQQPQYHFQHQQQPLSPCSFTFSNGVYYPIPEKK